MGLRYHHLAFGRHALARQDKTGSLSAYGADLVTPDSGCQSLGGREIAMITGCFQFHMATVGPAGWPYLQYRSGPAGFLHHLGGQTIGFGDHPGNQQFVSVGNIEDNGKVALFIADMPVRMRLKLFGTARVVEAEHDPKLIADLRRIDEHHMVAARCERGIVIDVEAFDWNCSRSLIPQYTREQVQAQLQPYVDEITSLRAEVARLRDDAGQQSGTSSDRPEMN